MKKSGIILLLVTVIVLSAVLLAACTSSDVEKGDEKQTTAQNDETTTASATTPTATTLYGPVPDVLTGEHFVGEDLSQYVKIAPYDGHVFSASEYRERYDYYNGVYMSRFGLYDELPADAILKLYDSVVFSFEGRPEDPSVTLSEQTLAGMKSEEYEIILGSDSFIGAYEKADDPTKNTKGFEEQMVGMKIGETKTLLVTFPDGYSEELGGLRVIFTVTVKSASEPGKMTDEVAVQNGFESAEAFYEGMEEAIKNEILYNFVMDNSEILDYPQKDIDALTEEYLGYFIEYMQQYSENGLTEDEIAKLKEDNRQDGIDWAKNYAGETMIVMLFGKLENHTVTKEMYFDWIKKQYGEDVPYTDVENYYGREVLYCQILLNESIESAMAKVTFEK